MSIVRDNGDERQIRVDRMVDELRKAQSRRLAKPATVKDNNQGVEPQRDTHGRAAVAGQVRHLLHTK